MKIETDRLILRRYRKDDLLDLHEYLSDEETVKFEPYEPMTMSEVEHNIEWRISSDEMIAVELKKNGKMIGNVYLGKRDFSSVEIGYVFNRRYWGMGYAYESCSILIENAFSNGVHRIYAECDPENQASYKLLERLGFFREGHLRQNVYFKKDENGKPIWKDTLVFGLINPKL